MQKPDSVQNPAVAKDSPLAARMRPRTLDEFIGQEHILGAGRLLRRAIQADQLSSILLYGPPGTGKTTLAQIIANTTRARFLAINAVLAGVKDIREAIETAREARQESQQKTILFVDEVHRFNKAQQDALLPHVENGTLTLIGATTENPYFEVNKALVSRSRIFQMHALGADNIRAVILAALADKDRGYGRQAVEMEPQALEHIVRVASGDARSALNALELAVETTPAGADGIARISLEVAEESIQRRAVLYDKDGDAHYDTISAFIKSMRGSDPDASLYWLSKMVYAGEDPRFIFRRMLILASEDVGMADPHALGVVAAAAQAFDYVGLPEGQFHLTQACLYLATAPKSNTALAYFEALESVRSEQQDQVPDPLKDKSRDGDGFGHGKGYLYPHAYRDHWVAQQYLPGALQGKIFYQPKDSGYESTIRDRVSRNREAQMAAMDQVQTTLEWTDVSKSRVGKNKRNTSSTWLDRAANQSSEVLKQVRDGIFQQAGLRQDSLVLDLGGGTGFLTWEACRLCPSGGVWSRCDDMENLQRMEEWASHVESLSRPSLLAASLEDLPATLRKESEQPRFDAFVGMDLMRKTQDAQAWIVGLRDFAAPGATLVLAEANASRSQRFTALLSKKSIDPALLAKVNDLEIAWQSSKPKSQLEKLQKQLMEHTDFRPSLVLGDFTVLKHFSPAQIRTWFSPAEAKSKDSLLSIVSAELSRGEQAAIEATLLDLFSGPGVDWRQSYDFLTLAFSAR